MGYTELAFEITNTYQLKNGDFCLDLHEETLDKDTFFTLKIKNIKNSAIPSVDRNGYLVNVSTDAIAFSFQSEINYNLINALFGRALCTPLFCFNGKNRRPNFDVLFLHNKKFNIFKNPVFCKCFTPKNIEDSAEFFLLIDIKNRVVKFFEVAKFHRSNLMKYLFCS